MINTFSKFYYGFIVDTDNQFIDFNEGGSELSAEIAVGSYTPTDFCVAVKTALDTAGALTYSVSFNRSTRKITISSSSNFTLLKSTGSHTGSMPFPLMGFTQSGNLSGASTYTGASVAGDFYAPQFKLQEYVASSDFQEAVDATVNESASGSVEVVSFGTRSFVEMNIVWANDLTQDNGVVKNNPTGVADLRRFMQYITTKAAVEFMPDENTPSTFEKVILEATPDSSKGVGFKLRESYDKGLPGYFQSGKLKFRVVEN